MNFDDSSTESSSTADLSPDVQSGLVTQLQTFNENYDNSNFSSIYTLKNELQNTLQNAYRTTKTAQLASVIESSGQTVTTASAGQDGIVSYTIDGLESLTVDNFTADNFNKTNYKVTELTDQMKISSGSPAYRLITSENWYVAVSYTHLDVYKRQVFDKITPSPKCWIYPSAHGSLNVVGALQHSCNDFFYEVGYRLGQDSNGNYDKMCIRDRPGTMGNAGI